jgi:RHS repeat-associated protein
VNSSGTVVETRDYDPFGADTAHTGTFSVQHRFTGQPADDQAGGLYNYGARFYNAKWGRFLSPDEVTQGFDSQGFNPYAYAGNAATSAIDPDGHDFYFPPISIPMIGTTSFGASGGGVGAAAPPNDGPLRGPWCDSTDCADPPLSSASVTLGGLGATSAIGNLPLLPALPGFYPLLEGFAGAAAETAITNVPTAVIIMILLYPGTANAPGIYQAEATGEGEGSSGRNEPHGDAGRKATKGEKQIQKLKDAIGKLKGQPGTSRERQQLEQKIKNIIKAGQRAAKGETHSR